MLVSDALSFNSLRAFALIFHLFFTIVLLTNKYDCISVTLDADFSRHQYTSTRRRFEGLLATGLILLALQFVLIGTSTNERTFAGTLNLLLDAIAAFFLIWMILDGLSWHTYIYILTFCVIVPTMWNLFTRIRFAVKNVWVKRLRETSLFEDVDACALTAAAGITTTCTSIGAGTSYVYHNFWPAMTHTCDMIGNAWFDFKTWFNRCIS